MRKTRLLVVDDEINIVRFLRANLEANGYEVLTAIDGAEAIEKIDMELPDLILLDIMMPKMDGFEVCRRIREWSNIPIIMLTARGDTNDIVKGLDLGADDYITKPFRSGELLARVKTALRRSGTTGTIPTQPFFTRGNLRIDFAKRQVYVADKEIKLTPTEYSLLQEFVLNTGKVLSYTHLLNKVWGPEYQEERWYVHVFVRRLRTKLEPDATESKYLLTVPGIGYRFNDDI